MRIIQRLATDFWDLLSFADATLVDYQQKRRAEARRLSAYPYERDRTHPATAMMPSRTRNVLSTGMWPTVLSK